MVLKSDQARVKALLKETITLLCKNGLSYQSEFCIEALIGITLDQDEVFLVSIKETFAAENASKTTCDSDSDLQEPDLCITAVQTHNSSSSRKLPKKTHPRLEMEAATRQTWSPCGSNRSGTESNVSNATPMHTYSSTGFHKTHSRKRIQGFDGNVGSPSLTNQSDSSLSSDNDKVSRDCNLSNRLQGEGHWEETSTEEPPHKKAGKYPAITDGSSDKYTQEIDSKSNILNSDVLFIKEETSKEDCSDSYSLSSGTLQPAGMPNVLASLAASLTQGPLGTYTGPGAATSWEQIPHVSRGSYLTSSTGPSDSQDQSTTSMPMHLAVTQPVNLLEALGSTAQTPVDMTMYFTSLAAAILRLEGSFVPVRVIKRKHQRFSTDEIVMVMKMMTTPQNSDEFVGEFRHLAHKVKIFYKCPPQLIKKPGLEKYHLTIEEYKEQYHKDPRPAKGGPYDWDAYLKIVMGNSPFLSYPSYGFYSEGGANVTVTNNAITW